MQAMVIIENKGVSGLKGLTQHLVRNLNFRQIELAEYTRWGGFLNCTIQGHEIITVENSAKDSEIHKYLTVFFGLSHDQAVEVLNNLIDMGFMKVTRQHSEWSKCGGWVKTVSPQT